MFRPRRRDQQHLSLTAGRRSTLLREDPEPQRRRLRPGCGSVDERAECLCDFDRAQRTEPQSPSAVKLLPKGVRNPLAVQLDPVRLGPLVAGCPLECCVEAVATVINWPDRHAIRNWPSFDRQQLIAHREPILERRHRLGPTPSYESRQDPHDNSRVLLGSRSLIGRGDIERNRGTIALWPKQSRGRARCQGESARPSAVATRACTPKEHGAVEASAAGRTRLGRPLRS
jgi:hypothetical protein